MNAEKLTQSPFLGACTILTQKPRKTSRIDHPLFYFGLFSKKKHSFSFEITRYGMTNAPIIGGDTSNRAKNVVKNELKH